MLNECGRNFFKEGFCLVDALVVIQEVVADVGQGDLAVSPDSAHTRIQRLSSQPRECHAKIVVVNLDTEEFLRTILKMFCNKSF